MSNVAKSVFDKGYNVIVSQLLVTVSLQEAQDWHTVEPKKEKIWKPWTNQLVNLFSPNDTIAPLFLLHSSTKKALG